MNHSDQWDEFTMLMIRMNTKFRELRNMKDMYILNGIYLNKKFDDSNNELQVIILSYTDHNHKIHDEELVSTSDKILAVELLTYAYRKYMWNWA